MHIYKRTERQNQKIQISKQNPWIPNFSFAPCCLQQPRTTLSQASSTHYRAQKHSVSLTHNRKMPPLLVPFTCTSVAASTRSLHYCQFRSSYTTVGFDPAVVDLPSLACCLLLPSLSSAAQGNLCGRQLHKEITLRLCLRFGDEYNRGDIVNLRQYIMPFLF